MLPLWGGESNFSSPIDIPWRIGRKLLGKKLFRAASLTSTGLTRSCHSHALNPSWLSTMTRELSADPFSFALSLVIHHQWRSGGNQRDTDRAKAQKKAASMKSKPKESNASLAKRREAYAISLYLFFYPCFSIPTMASFFLLFFLQGCRDPSIKAKGTRHVKHLFFFSSI